MTGADPMRLAQDERADLADFLAGLEPEQWEAPTLCSKWPVRDGVAHISTATHRQRGHQRGTSPPGQPLDADRGA